MVLRLLANCDQVRAPRSVKLSEAFSVSTKAAKRGRHSVSESSSMIGPGTLICSYRYKNTTDHLSSLMSFGSEDGRTSLVAVSMNDQQHFTKICGASFRDRCGTPP